jgi:hypothetical protein
MKKALSALAFLLLPGCAARMMQASQGECAAFGLEPGSTQYAQCVERGYRGRLNRISEIGASLSAASSPSAPSLPSTGATAFLRGQHTEGQSKICIYDRLGSPYVITIGIVELCPITLP